MLWRVQHLNHFENSLCMSTAWDVCQLLSMQLLITWFFYHRLIHRALARWRDRELRADNTSAIVVHFDEADLGEPASKMPRLETPESEEETETDVNQSTDSSQESDKTPNQDLTLSSEKPTLVRKLAFRCSNPLQLTSCVNHSSNTSSHGLVSSFNSLSNVHSSPVVSNCLS